MKKVLFLLVFYFCGFLLFAQEGGRTVIPLNGQWNFDQTKTVLKLINSKGEVVTQQDIAMRTDPLSKKIKPCLVELPKEEGGYLLVAEYYPGGKSQPVISRRYLKVGYSKDDKYDFYEMKL